MAKKDYPELEGSLVTVITSCGSEFAGIVAGVNFDVGLTIEQKDPEEEERLLCLHGPLYKPADGKSNYVEKSYKTEFYTSIALIKKGEVRISVLDKVEVLKAGEPHDSEFGGSVMTCSFT